MRLTNFQIAQVIQWPPDVCNYMTVLVQGYNQCLLNPKQNGMVVETMPLCNHKMKIVDERGIDMDVVGKCAESDDNSGETRGSNSNINSILCLVTNLHPLIYHPITAKFNHCSHPV